MVTRMVFFIFLVLTLTGCATGAKKQTTQPQPVSYERPQKTYQQESYSEDYDYEDAWLSDEYDKPAKKTSILEPAVRLSAKQIQRALRNAGFYKGKIDGKLGPKTKEAIIKFQKSNGLKADGIIGKKTSAELNKYLPK